MVPSCKKSDTLELEIVQRREAKMIKGFTVIQATPEWSGTLYNEEDMIQWASLSSRMSLVTWRSYIRIVCLLCPPEQLLRPMKWSHIIHRNHKIKGREFSEVILRWCFRATNDHLHCIRNPKEFIEAKAHHPGYFKGTWSSGNLTETKFLQLSEMLD